MKTTSDSFSLMPPEGNEKALRGCESAGLSTATGKVYRR
jgi:hypothetical protein